MVVNVDCRLYRGDVPCRPHKLFGVHCGSCSYYERVEQKILIIKLGAIGDVIRSTPLLQKLKAVYPQSEIHWLTYFPEILPSLVDQKHFFGWKSLEFLQEMTFDILINLDKDREACAVAKRFNAHLKRGFTLGDRACITISSESEAKWLTGLFDDLNRANMKSYPQEIFEICGFHFEGEQYLLDIPDIPPPWRPNDTRKVVGLNTGCGSRWKTRLWPDERWIDLAKKLLESGLKVVLLGGEQEDERNKKIAGETRADYPGCFPLKQFISLIGQCDLIVTSVTMALHLALGLKKKVVLFNNIFNWHEFELYGNGVIIEPDVNCKGCFKSSYDEMCPTHCMELIDVAEVEKSCLAILR